MYYVHRRFNSNTIPSLPHMSMSMCNITARVIQSCSLSGTTCHLNQSLLPLETELHTDWKVSTKPQISHCCVDHTECLPGWCRHTLRERAQGCIGALPQKKKIKKADRRHFRCRRPERDILNPLRFYASICSVILRPARCIARKRLTAIPSACHIRDLKLEAGLDRAL